MSEIVVGVEPSQQLRIDVFGRERDTDDYHDGNWLRCRLSLRSATFAGTVDSSLHTTELATFEHWLREMLAGVSDGALLEAMEGILAIDVKTAGRNFSLQATLREPSIGTSMTTMFSMKREHVEGLLNDIVAVLEVFPVRGEEGDPPH